MMDLKKLTAPCGLPCFACSVYKDNITDELAKQFTEQLGVKAGEMPCEGCWSEQRCSSEIQLSNGTGFPTKK